MPNKPKRAFGDPIVGEWICLTCSHRIFPNPLKAKQNDYSWTTATLVPGKPILVPMCPVCKTALTYDEAE